MPRPEPIKKEKLILAEGKDAYHFFCHACNFYRETQDVQVMKFEGNDNLPSFLLGLTIMDGFDEVNTIVIARDAETDAKAATDSIKHSMKQATIPVPEKPFEYIRNATLKTAFMIFPGPQQKDGTLEDLCLLTVENDPLLECVDGYLECAKAKGEQFPRIHKNRLHCFLAGKDDSVGLPIGLAFKAKVWPPEHIALKPFKKIIQEM
ncbi:MAG: hypothetical protein IIC00_14070 [Planctomycetes bacterium]|nr:hypothetical protein [Planctomycetota bacterium]